MWILVEFDDRVSCTCENDMSGNSGWVYHNGNVPENYNDYIYENGEFIYSPMPIPEQEELPKSELEELINILLGGEE